MKSIDHIVTTREFEHDWIKMLHENKDAVYETFLGYYLRLRNQLNEPVEHPNTFGFMINVDGFIPAKTGVVFHKFWPRHGDPLTRFNFGEKRELLGMLEDHDLDFNYQKLHAQLIQPMPRENEHIAVMAYYTPHELAREPEVRGNQFDDFAMLPAPSHQFYKLMNTHENKIFAME
jgi:hypothetical protein